jgi:hypothetical protein
MIILSLTKQERKQTMSKLIAMTAREYKDGAETKTFWMEIGVAFPTKSGSGFNVLLNALPIDGRFSLFPPKEKPKSEPEAQA